MSHPSIINMNWTTGQMEQIRDAAIEERRQKREQMRHETDDLIEKITAFFPDTDAGIKAWGKWIDAGPDDNAAFLEYCRAEWARIVSEIEFAHRLAGLRFIIAQPAQSVLTINQ